MDRQTARHTLRVVNPQGFHMRPCAAFAAEAARFRCDVRVVKDDRAVNGKSVLDLMTLGAAQGTELTLEAAGDDSRQALEALVALWETFAEKSGPEA